ncbi:hypothetical protein L195_g060437, partial [Trifolium pratense]
RLISHGRITFMKEQGKPALIPTDAVRKRKGITSVLKTGPVIEPARALVHWFIGRTTGSLVEPHDKPD